MIVTWDDISNHIIFSQLLDINYDISTDNSVYAKIYKHLRYMIPSIDITSDKTVFVDHVESYSYNHRTSTLLYYKSIENPLREYMIEHNTTMYLDNVLKGYIYHTFNLTIHNII